MKYLFICIALLLSVCCNQQSLEFSEVKTFIETLKEDQKGMTDVPSFKVDHISELLKFRNKEMKILNFPRNPLSSFYMEEVTLGMYVLWIIESIRMEAISDPNFYLFASLNPRIIRESTRELLNQDIILPEVSVAYYEWWNSNLPFEEKLQINPLEELDLNWN